MKKSLIALAVAGAFAAPAFAATSNVDIYGTVDASVTKADVKVGGTKLADEWHVGNIGAIDSSKIGFKGSEDLGGGLKAIWQIESKVNLDSETSIGGRNTFVGLSGGFGTVISGRHDTPEKLSTASLDMFADTVGDFNLTATIVDTRETNVLAYISPTWSGFHFAVATVAGEGSNSGKNDSLADHYSMAGIYSNGPLFLSAAYTSLSAGYKVDLTQVLGETTSVGAGAVVQTKDVDMYRIGVGYTMGDLKLAAVYQNIDVDTVDALEKGYTVGAAYTMGPVVLKAQYNHRDDLLEGWTIGADYNLSKRTKAYVVYTDQSEESGAVKADANLLSIGVRHNF